MYYSYMSNPLKDYGHLSYIPLIGHTKEWFKRDIKTIKKSLFTTLKYSPFLLILEIGIVCLTYYLSTTSFVISEIFVYIIIFSPIILLAFFLLHIMKTKGYDMGSEIGC